MLLTHVWYQCMTTGPWQTAVSGKRASSTTQPPKSTPTSQFCTHNHLCFFSLHPNVFWPSQLVFFFLLYVCLNHSSPPALFPSILFQFSFYCLSFSPSTSLPPPHPYVTLVAVSYRNRSSEKPPVTLRSQIAMNVCVCHTLSSSPVQQRPHRIYVPRCQSHSDPRDFLIINSNLNLTSNADPRDNIVVTISTHKNWLQVL